MHDTTRPEPSRSYRWAVLIFVSLAQAGNYYIYDSINALERIFIDHLGFSATQFGWLNASYSVAAVATLLVGGIIIDRIGTKKSILAFAVICFLGAALTASKGSAPVMIAGRTVLGLGAESMIVAVTTALAKWFRGKELSFAFGINLTIARLASVAADNSPTWANRAFYPDGPAGQPSWQNPLLIAVGAGLFAILCSVMYWILESRAEKQYELGKAGSVDRIDFGETFRIRGLNLEQAIRKIWRGLLDLFRFNPSYWLVVGLCFTFYSAIFPFRTFAIDLFTNKILAAHGVVRASRRQGWQARSVHDVWLALADAGVSHDRVLPILAVHTGFHDGNCIFIDSRRYVAVGGVHRGSVPAGYCIRTDDPDTTNRVLHSEPVNRQGERLCSCGLGQSWRIRARHVDLLDPRLCGNGTRPSSSHTGNRSARAQAGNHHVVSDKLET